ncbi:unnamed protein product [Amoebophrya sp. A120]|nr:unnamed protein product [Amoebophrya sp. A120]|eukprot:GSA120T00000299001.1
MLCHSVVQKINEIQKENIASIEVDFCIRWFFLAIPRRPSLRTRKARRAATRCSRPSLKVMARPGWWKKRVWWLPSASVFIWDLLCLLSVNGLRMTMWTTLPFKMTNPSITKNPSRTTVRRQMLSLTYTSSCCACMTVNMTPREESPCLFCCRLLRICCSRSIRKGFSLGFRV